ncbi:NAD(P)-binding protein [Hypomontagnella monticulosa]|nr:NAD(P)-binding protein [Hypomontagnella monticulosa]
MQITKTVTITLTPESDLDSDSDLNLIPMTSISASSRTRDPEKLIAFLGASGGVGLGALTRALAAGHTCVALCRSPAKLTDRFPASQHPNLHIVSGNAHDSAAVARCLVSPTEPGRFVDAVVSSIGGAFQFQRMTLDDPHVCEKGMKALLDAISQVRSDKKNNINHNASIEAWNPHLTVVSTCGISAGGWDFPVLLLPMYRWVLRVPHEDKLAMEAELKRGARDLGYTYTIVRPSLLADTPAPERMIRVGLGEEPAVGYTISRDDTGRWIYENLLDGNGGCGGFENQVATITW